ncbi:hypothetical protein OG21DRAFT_831357 [Imleria badia]|nr:hypothetical protein OG21DRAFT_831357 [Imleria badia]
MWCPPGSARSARTRRRVDHVTDVRSSGLTLSKLGNRPSVLIFVLFFSCHWMSVRGTFHDAWFSAPWLCTCSSNFNSFFLVSYFLRQGLVCWYALFLWSFFLYIRFRPGYITMTTTCLRFHSPQLGAPLAALPQWRVGSLGLMNSVLSSSFLNIKDSRNTQT